jgi:mannose-6-phosphate isomerase-like protein (cupin superfamily)
MPSGPGEDDGMSDNEHVDLTTGAIHLGTGARAVPLPDFDWSAEYLEGYQLRFAADGIEGRLVVMVGGGDDWTSWERHPAGEEVVLVVSGRLDLIQRTVDGGERRIPLGPGQAAINPAGVWHTADVHEAGQALFITPGRGTEHEPRTLSG